MRRENRRTIYDRISGAFLMSIRRQKEHRAATLAKVLKPTLVVGYPPQLRGHRDEQSPSHAFKMPLYLVKPREPTILSHKEYHELSSANLMLSAVVMLPFPSEVPQNQTNPWFCAAGPDRPHNSRDLGHRKVQRCIGRGVVELSAPCGETGQTKYTRGTLEGAP